MARSNLDFPAKPIVTTIAGAKATAAAIASIQTIPLSVRAIEYWVIRSFELEGAEIAYPFTVQMSGTIDLHCTTHYRCDRYN